MYWVDTTVTGSNSGTSDEPKFPLKRVFQHSVFPNLDSLVRPGGKFDGYTVIIQGDQAGPHEEDDFVKRRSDPVIFFGSKVKKVSFGAQLSRQ